MKRSFQASISREGAWFVAQCLEIDIASQGESEADALANLEEAIQLYFEHPTADLSPQVRTIHVEVDAA